MTDHEAAAPAEGTTPRSVDAAARRESATARREDAAAQREGTTASRIQAVPFARSTTAERLAELARRRADLERPFDEQAVRRQHAKGKLTARERIEALLDPGSFTELDALARHRSHNFGMAEQRPYGDGVVTGHGTIEGRQVALFAQDFTVFGGSLGEVYGEKIIKVMDFALKAGCPIIGINDSGGARIQEGVVSLAYYAELVRRHVEASGVIPQISLMTGPCAGGAVYAPAITDFVVMVEGISHMFVTGPEVLRTVTGQAVDREELGGAHSNNAVSGNAHYLAQDEKDAFEYVRLLLGYLPANNMEDPPVYGGPERQDEPTEADLALDTLIPDDRNRPYDMTRVVHGVLDDGELLEVQPLFARNMICGLGRVEGRSVGVVANQPMHMAGALDIDASEKAARFIRMCDAFHIPVLSFVDVPGFLPSVEQEQSGIIRRGAKLIYAYAEATVPMVTVVTRKAYGGGYGVMGSKHLGTDVNLAWPTSEIAVMGGEGAVSVLHRRALQEAADPAVERARLMEEYERTLCNPYVAAERGYVDAVIMPHETRAQVGSALRALRDKRRTRLPRKHGNIPL
ncbi:acyl-CoA carboxylase subunit beta [Streptomyces sp. TS71-3]|uniref:acyl-CoA carboxylase subunit beta n=1 Tax=Streptomyces sp. TS71-3 TaxID=2733862 RepID=UPI001B239FAB|nr:acyl-CoA carboxylase subunit beta [Streptomyces sp. TS71-3]GHJ40932.1 methylmalonyl-CoA carboxyltransferase [Streptomyces sp. TS71-3]